MGQNLPAAGGGYLRIFPSAFTELAFNQFENNYGERVVVYLHPWEVDPEQPRISGSLKSRLRHYTSLSRMSGKIDSILRRHQFERFSDVMAAEAAENQALPQATVNQPKETAEHAHVAGGGR